MLCNISRYEIWQHFPAYTLSPSPFLYCHVYMHQILILHCQGFQHLHSVCHHISTVVQTIFKLILCSLTMLSGTASFFLNSLFDVSLGRLNLFIKEIFAFVFLFFLLSMSAIFCDSFLAWKYHSVAFMLNQYLG